jgi:hypothetical protein
VYYHLLLVSSLSFGSWYSTPHIVANSVDPDTVVLTGLANFRVVGKPEVIIGPSSARQGFAILSKVNHSPILLGTSSFTATGWRRSFYPKGLRPADYLSYYAQHFDTVEIDSTFYATPNVSVVRSWNAKTPEGFLLRPRYHRRLHTRGFSKIVMRSSKSF